MINVREARENKIDRLKDELAKAKEKSSIWQARVRDIERQITEQENLTILQAVRSVAASPEELRDLLDLIRSSKEPPATTTNLRKE